MLGVGAIGSLARGCEDDPPTPRERVVQVANERRVENGQPRVRANAKRNEAAHIGIGLATSADGTGYWTMVLARPA